MRTSLCEWLLLSALLLPSTAGMVLYGGVRLWMSGPLMLVVFGAAALMLLRAAAAPSDSNAISIPPGGLLVFAFVAYALIRIPESAVPYEAKLDALKLGTYVAAYWMICALASVHGRWRILLAAPLLAGSLLCWYAIVQDVHGSTMVLTMERPEQYGLRASATYICPNHFAHVLEVLIVFAVAIVCTPRAGWALRILGAYTALVCFPVLVMTGSRSGWIGAAIGLTTYGIATASRKGARRLVATLVAAPVALVVVGWLLWTYSVTFEERVREADFRNMRVAVWQDTLEAIRDRPVFGHGGGSYRWIYPGYKEAYSDPLAVPRYAHNEYLNHIAEYGAAGAAVLGLVVLITAARLLPLVRRARSDTAAAMLSAWVGCVAGTLAHAFFDFNLHLFANVHLLVLLGAVVSGMLFSTGDLRPVPMPRMPFRIAAAAGVFCSVALAGLTWQMLSAYRWTDRAEAYRMDLDFDAALAAADHATGIDANYWEAHKERANALKSKCFWNPDREEKAQQAEDAAASYRRALELNPYDLHGKVELSRLEGDVFGRQETALRLVQEIVDTAPNLFYYRAELGLRLRSMGRHEQALEAFLKARELNPDDEMSRLNIRRLRKIVPAPAEPVPPASARVIDLPNPAQDSWGGVSMLRPV